MRTVFANRTAKNDFIVNEVVDLAIGGGDIFIASAFFTNSEVVEQLIEYGCNVFIVLRLGFPTNPDAIKKIYQHPKVQLRFYTGHSFHPKLYIFSDDAALVGSANLTKAAFMSNQEVMVRIDADDERFIELQNIFEEYFNEADVLTPTQLEVYKKLYVEFSKHQAAGEKVGRRVLEVLGDKSPRNIVRGEKRNTSKSIYTAGFRRSYQECVSAFNVIRQIYQTTGYRKSDAVPLRVEIDSFISFVREKIAVGDSWKNAPMRTAAEQGPFILSHIEKWAETPWPYFEHTVATEKYPRLLKVFASPTDILSSNDSDLFDALATLHSFHDRLRFVNGGLAAWKQEFLALNDPSKLRKTLSYLVYGAGDVVERMADALFNPNYKLNEFGRANVQELIGWLSKEDLPVVNGRTTKILRYFGSRVKQLNER